MIFKKEINNYIFGAFFAALVSFYSYEYGLLNKIENILYDLRVNILSSYNSPSENIKLIVVDQNSLEWAKESNGLGWPWPREMYSAINDFLQKSGAQIVIYDIIYSEPSFYGRDDDKRFSSSLQTIPSIGSIVLTKGNDGVEKWPLEINKPKVFYHKLCQDNNYKKLILPTEEIFKGFNSVGLANADVDNDGVIRKFNLCYNFDDFELPTLASLVYKQLSQTDYDFKSSDLYINYYNAPFSFKTFSAASIINSWQKINNGEKSTISQSEFKDAIVFVGVSASGLYDNKTTPLSNNHPGIDIQATILDNLFQQNIIYKSADIVLVLLLIINSILTVLSIYLYKKIWKIFLLVSLLISLSFFYSFYLYSLNILLPLAPILLSIISALIISGMMGYVIERRKKEKAIIEKNEKIKELLDSFIKLIASAIDAKSKYTGGHCLRVPELLLMMTDAANEANYGIFKDFTIENEDKKRELSIAAWLHDCGKVTTPEYVVDKATKLETIYNRIHEIRTRFEVIHRDLTIEALNKKLAGEDCESVDSWLVLEHKKLIEEFEIVANANVGGEFMKDEDKELIKDIASRMWIRNFDNTIGLANEEKQRVLNENSVTPQIEQLLADKLQHIIPREDFDYEEYKRMKFKTKVPDQLYNRGEIYNLTIEKGTLTEEERFKISEHVMVTIKMLEELPFPENLKNVPLYAGAHHETLIGTGYPRELSIDDMPIPARIMALVDIFEALTASDRPYKEPKTISESIKILSFMVKDKHIDKDIFELFLKSGVYQEYADKNIKLSQHDEVNIDKYI